jgi:predicted RNA-binding protein Jag
LYDYNKGFLSLGPDLVKLQESALRESIRKIEQASCKEWLMKTANERVQQTAQSFLNQLLNNKGYTVSVKIQIPSDDTCQKNT